MPDVQEIWTVEIHGSTGWAPLLGVMVNTEAEAITEMEDRIAQGFEKSELRVKCWHRRERLSESKLVTNE